MVQEVGGCRAGGCRTTSGGSCGMGWPLAMGGGPLGLGKMAQGVRRHRRRGVGGCTVAGRRVHWAGQRMRQGRTPDIFQRLAAGDGGTTLGDVGRD